jgi:CheY-like chemotaxis protein
LAVQSIETLIRRSIGENIAIETDLAADEAKALTDQHQLESALLNLALNARDAMPDGGRIRISTRPVHFSAHAANADLNSGDYLLLTVSDTGVGMRPEIVARAFEPFFTTKPSGVGTGLGLSMVYGFVKQTGGHVAIESAEGQGTVIKLYLPVAPVETLEETQPRETNPPKGRGEVVLVVEDDALVRTLVRDVLEDLGYEPLLAADAKMALPLLESKQRIDLLISDVGLPGLNGRQLAEMARQFRPELKVLFLTGYAEHASVRSTFLGRDMELMTKPFAVDELAAKIKEMLVLVRQSADA